MCRRAQRQRINVHIIELQNIGFYVVVPEQVHPPHDFAVQNLSLFFQGVYFILGFIKTYGMKMVTSAFFIAFLGWACEVYTATNIPASVHRSHTNLYGTN